MAGFATKKVEAEPGLVPRLAGGGSAPPSLEDMDTILCFFSASRDKS